MGEGIPHKTLPLLYWRGLFIRLLCLVLTKESTRHKNNSINHDLQDDKIHTYQIVCYGSFIIDVGQTRARLCRKYLNIFSGGDPDATNFASTGFVGE